MSSKFKLLLTVLFLCTATVWIAVFTHQDQKLRIIACDVGQGDAFLITYKSNQILIDGGPNDRVINCLEKHIPFWDRNIELVILTHPQKDHFTGLIKVFQYYTVDAFLRNPIQISTPEYTLLNNQVQQGGVRELKPEDGLNLRLGLIYLDILWPKPEYIKQKCSLSSEDIKINEESIKAEYSCDSKIDLNVFSIVILLKYADFEAIFTGDIDPQISDMIAGDYKSHYNFDSEYIKIAHHGSKNGISSNLIKVLKPNIAVISAGKNNSFGHPHKEIIEILSSFAVKILRTDEIGDVVVEYDERYEMGSER